MNREFKKIKGKMETRYVLESASAGATGAGAIATVVKPLEDKDGKPEVQRRNPVAANVNAAVGGGGAGAHKDRKQAMKRGEQKHKKDWRKDVDEGVAEAAATKTRLDPKCWSGKKIGTPATKVKGGVRVNNCVPKESVAEGYGMGAYNTVMGSEPIAKHVPEDNVDPGYIDQENGMTASDLKGLYQQAVKLRSLVKRMGDDTTLEPWQQTKIAKAADYVNSVFRSLDDEYGLDALEEAEKKGLWANIHARRKKGLPARKPGDAGAPSKKSWDAAVAASKKKKAVGEDNLSEYETYTYTDKQGRRWRVDDEGNKDLIYDPNDRFSKRSSYTKPSQPSVYYFYNVPDGAAMQAHDLGLKRTKSGKWYSASPNASAEKEFGKARMWKPKAEESMMPASHFAGTPKNKLGPAAHLKGKMKRAARQGDLVGSAEEGYSKKKLK